MLHSHIKKLPGGPRHVRYVCPRAVLLQFNEFRAPMPGSIHSRHSNYVSALSTLLAYGNTISRNLTRVRFFTLFPSSLSVHRQTSWYSRSSIPPDFDWTRRASFLEIVKVSRDTMNYSCRGDAKLRETFLRRGESVLCARSKLRARVSRVLST